MRVSIAEDIMPPDIDAVRTIRVAVATDKRSGKQGIMTIHAPGMGAVPMLWGDDARTAKFMPMLEDAARQASNMRIEVKEYVLSDKPSKVIKP